MQTRIHIFAHPMHLSRKQEQLRVCAIQRIYSDGFVCECIGVIPICERVRHPWGRMILHVIVVSIVTALYSVDEPFDLLCRSPIPVYAVAATATKAARAP